MRASRPARLLAAAAATTLAMGVALTGPARADSASPSPASSTGKVVFTVGMTQDIDSANPFTGIAYNAYEIFQMGSGRM